MAILKEFSISIIGHNEKRYPKTISDVVKGNSEAQEVNNRIEGWVAVACMLSTSRSPWALNLRTCGQDTLGIEIG